MSWIATFTGKRFDLLDPQPEQIDIVDIAVALSRLPRFAGHTLQPYSVGQHSLMVASLASPKARPLGLLHDASEAYLMDLPRPLKEELPEYRTIEKQVQRAILEKFQVPFTAAIAEEIAVHDGNCLETERVQLFPQSPPWGRQYGRVLPQTITPRPAKLVARDFLREFEQVFDQRVDVARLHVA